MLSSMVLNSTVQLAPLSWLTTFWPFGGAKSLTVKNSIVTLVAVPSKADWLTPWPSITAPGAPIKVSPSCGSTWPYCPGPRVCTPGANQ